mmetsp:Transcript_18599/g.41778  ORF Transcript_18599/g.41778 Transcript_18599/m.41778 type:complete len:213 (+) Transcript_18599:55-693(+)
MRLYHATDDNAAEEIKRVRRFRCGTHGFAGGAIYFSAKKAAACRKIRNGRGNPDVVITCEVDLGRTIFAREHEMNRQRCESSGYDSVRITGLDVYAVYEPDRITILQFENLHTGQVSTLQQEGNYFGSSANCAPYVPSGGYTYSDPYQQHHEEVQRQEREELRRRQESERQEGERQEQMRRLREREQQERMWQRQQERERHEREQQPGCMIL